MTKTRVYLDYNATTPVDPDVREAMLPYLGGIFGNPSSMHWAGFEARKALEEAREQVASSLGCESREIIFTSGGTESINLALSGVVKHAMAMGKKRSVSLVTTAIEHQAVLKTCENLEKDGLAKAAFLSVDSLGRINLEALRTSLSMETVLLSVMMANNEIGNIYPIAEMGKMARDKGILFHVDAVQAVGKLKMNLKNLPVDLLSFSGHKIYGPKGVGCLYIRKGVRLQPLIFGGAQEWEKRAGTENLPGIVGLGKALSKVCKNIDSEGLRLQRLRDRLEDGLKKASLGVIVYGDPEHRLPNTLKVSFEGVQDEADPFAHRGDKQTRDGRADKPGGVEHGGIEGNRVPQVFTVVDHFHEERLAGRYIKGADNAEDKA